MSTDDLLAECRDAVDLYPAVERALNDLIGHKLFTLMAIDWPRGQAARIYTNMPQEYPIGGRKPLGGLTAWGKTVLEGRHAWIAHSAGDIRGAFFDHELILALGCAACLNVPVIDAGATGGPRVIGTVNMLHEAGHYQQDHARIAVPFAQLLVQPFRDWAIAPR